MQYKRLFTPPRTKGAKDRKARRAQRKETREASHRLSLIDKKVKVEEKVS